MPNVNEDLQARLQNITQQILSRTRLLHIIDELNLYAKDRPRLSPDEIVDRMRKDIEIELVQDAQKQVTAFRIHYSAHDPSIAQQVTSKLTNLFINENLEVRQQQSEGTTKFLEDQMETARQRPGGTRGEDPRVQGTACCRTPDSAGKQSPNTEWAAIAIAD